MRGVQENVFMLLSNILAARRPTLLKLSSTSRCTLVASVTGAIQSAVDDRPAVFESCEFEDDIIKIVLGFLGSSDVDLTKRECSVTNDKQWGSSS